MEFEESGLPQDHRIKLCFERIKEFYKPGWHGDPDIIVEHIAQVGKLIAEASPPDNPPVPLICAIFRIHLKEDSFEYDNIRHDYGHDVFQAVKAQKSFRPLFEAPEFKAEVLNDAEVHPDVRMMNMANSIVGLRNLAEFYKEDPDLTEDVVLFSNYESFILIGNGCRGASNMLDYLFDEEAKNCRALLSGQPVPDPQPATRPQGPKPMLH